MTVKFNIALTDEAFYKDHYAKIEDFYQSLIFHQIKRDESNFLSALEFMPADGRALKTLVIIPGRAEIEHKYAELIYSLRELPLRILVPFVRGQGMSSPVIPGSHKCHIEDFNLYRQDIDFMLDELQVSDFVQMGFSMGGLISTDLAAHGRHKPQRLALMAPYLWPAYNLPAPILRAFVGFMGSMPGLKTMYTPHGSEYKRLPFEENIHSHSRLRYERYHDYYAQHPELALAGPSYSFVRQSLLKQSELYFSHFEFTMPVFCAAAACDKVVSAAHCQSFMESHQRDVIKPKFVRVAGAYHDILNEADEYRNPIMTRALNFLLNDGN